MPSMDNCHAILEYCSETGRLFWKPRKLGPKWWNTRYAGKEAFTSLDTDGYKQGAINGKPMRAQYVVWVMHHGNNFPECIDHINRVRADNRIENLRPSTPAANAINRTNRDNAAGHVGVYKCGKKWRARVRSGNVMHNAGSFSNINDAVAAREKLALALRGAP